MPDIVRVTNYVDGDILDADDLNSEFNNIIAGLNNLDDDNVSATAAIAPSKISASIAGSGLTKNPSTGAIDGVPDNTTVEISSNAWQIKDGGITAGKLATDSVTTAKIQASAVTRAKLAALGQQSTGPQADNETSTSYVDLSGFSVSLTTTGRPVLIMLQGLGVTTAQVSVGIASGEAASGSLKFVRDSTDLAEYTLAMTINDGAANIDLNSLTVPPSSFWVIDTPAAGTYTYKLQGKVNTGDAINVRAALVAWELV